MTKSKNKKPSTTEPIGLDQGVVEQSPSRRPNGFRRSSISNHEPSLTQQQFKASVDVNNIVRSYARTGIDPYESRKQNMRFQDMTAQSFTESAFKVAEINSAFAELPAEIRQTFSNDPSQWLESLEGETQGSDEIVPPVDAQEVDIESDPPEPAPNSENGAEGT